MRALVLGAVKDERNKILLDTGAYISAISELFARKLRLQRLTINDKQIGVQGIGKSKVVTTSRTTLKIPLGWEVVYNFEVWIIPHHAGVDLILRTDFLRSAGIRLDLFNAKTELPDEITIPLKEIGERSLRHHVRR